MARVISVPVDSKGKNSVLIEVTDAPEPTSKKAESKQLGNKMGGGGKTIREASRNLEDALSDVGPAIDALRKMAASVSAPKEISLEVGLKLTAKAGIILASADAEGSIKVTLKWVS
jgi:hypothetical protein